MRLLRWKTVAIVCLLVGHLGVFRGDVKGQTVAGTEVLTGAGDPDGWTNILYINESFPFELGPDGGTLTYTNFFAAQPNGLYTPFVAEPLTDFPATGDDYVIRAIGTTRAGGRDYVCSGEFQFPFHDSETFNVQDGWVAGFLSSDPLGESADAQSPIPFTASGIEGWLTGSATAGSGLPAIEMGETITEGADGTDIDAFGLREYQFNISAVAGDTQPPLDQGGRVGEACPPPPTEEPGKIGAPLPLSDGTPDGWSGVPVLYGYELTPGETVDVVRYYAADVREFEVQDEFHQVTPLIVKQEDGSVENGEGIFSVWEVGPNHTPTEIGENELTWGSSPIPDDDHLYHPAVLQWSEGVDNTNGGVVAFGDGGGTGMHYFDVETFDFVPDEDIGDIEPDFVLSDLTTHSSAAGGRDYQLNFEMSGAGGEPGDFNQDGMLDSSDIDNLTQQSAAGTHPPSHDLTGDDLVNAMDVRFWIVDLVGSWVGDANVDGEFNTADLVQVLAAGTYEQDVEAVWSSGDFNGDGRANTADLVVALSDGGYEQGPRQAAKGVPEPMSSSILVFGTAAVLLRFRRLATARKG